MPDHDRYQGVSGMSGVGVSGQMGVGHGLDSSGGYGGVGGVGGGGATATALSLMHALPLQYLPPVAAAAPAPDHHHHWDQSHHHANDKQTWSKWTH